MKNIFLVEDHHQALDVWRKSGVKNMDLVHLDAHIDFGFYQAKPQGQIIKEAKSLSSLKQELEKSLLYQRYDGDFNKQTNIGNYIYPAMCEGIIKDFYWIIPGTLEDFRKSSKFIKNMLKVFSRQDPYYSGRSLSASRSIKEGVINAKIFGRKFIISILEKLPILRQNVLLDIDTDFLTTDSLLNSNNTSNIGRRVPWISPYRLVKVLTDRIKNPEITTIAYSVNGGFTPMRYKVLADELAYHLSPEHFKEHYRQKFIASVLFECFEFAGGKKYYLEAIKRDPAYRAADNNYGPLYLQIGKFSRAKKEFSRIANVDPGNSYPLIGLGNIALSEKDYYLARIYFLRALKINNKLLQALFGLAQVEFNLKSFERAKLLFNQYQKFDPLNPRSHYFLGKIYENEKKYQIAAGFYQDSLRLGMNNIDIIKRLLRVSNYMKSDDLMKFISRSYDNFKKGFEKTQYLEKKTSRSRKIKKTIMAVERRIKNYHYGRNPI